MPVHSTLNISETVQDRDNGMLIGTYTWTTQGCHFEWPLVALSDLEKSLVTRSIVQPICDSWASCNIM